MILVVGSTGFLGKRVCRLLDRQNISYVNTSKSLGLDLTIKKDTIDFFKSIKPKYVLNCAAFVGGIQFGLKHSAEIFSQNMSIILNLLVASKESNVNRIVNPISNCAYPASATFFKEDEFWSGPMHETVEVYGLTRKAMCLGSSAFNRQYGLDTINIILSNMYGPEDHFDEERSHALGALIMKIVNAKINNKPKVVVWGTGKPVREWLHVDDAAQAMLLSMDAKSSDDPLNIGVGKGISIFELATLIKDLCGYKGKLILDPTKPDGASHKTVDGSKGFEHFNWRPQINFKAGVLETIQWFERSLNGRN